jgi:hypothetical protein
MHNSNNRTMLCLNNATHDTNYDVIDVMIFMTFDVKGEVSLKNDS